MLYNNLMFIIPARDEKRSVTDHRTFLLNIEE